METLDPQGDASLIPRGLIGRFCVGDHYTLLHTKYISCGPHGFREKYFESFFNIMSMCCHSNGPHGFREKYFESFFNIMSMCCHSNRPKNLMQPFSLYYARLFWCINVWNYGL